MGELTRGSATCRKTQIPWCAMDVFLKILGAIAIVILAVLLGKARRDCDG